MKGSSALLKTILSLTIACCFFTPGRKWIFSPLLSNPFKELQEWVQHILEPRIDRNVFQEPESFMTTVMIFNFACVLKHFFFFGKLLTMMAFEWES